jgi:type II secretory pathway component PulJ
MIELLLAVSLLSMLTLGVASWVQTTARSSAQCAAPLRWHAGAQAVLQLIHDDLASGDFAADDRSLRPSPRVRVVDGALHLETRAGRAVQHIYRLDVPGHELALTRVAGGRRSARTLLQHVQDWQCTLDENQRILTVSIASLEAATLTRRYQLP